MGLTLEFRITSLSLLGFWPSQHVTTVPNHDTGYPRGPSKLREGDRANGENLPERLAEVKEHESRGLPKLQSLFFSFSTHVTWVN